MGVRAQSPIGAVTEATGDARYVNVTGDTMTGDLSVLAHVAFGAAATIQANNTVYVKETLTDMGAALTLKTNYLSELDLNPSGAVGSTFQMGLVSRVSTRSGNAQNFFITNGISAEAYHNGSGTTTNARGVSGYVVNAGPGTINDAAAVGGIAEASDGTILVCAGFYGYAYAYGDSAINNAYGIRTFAATADDTAVITNAYGVHVGDPYKAAGATVTNNYGIYIADQSPIGSTIARNFHSAGASSTNLFEGAVTINGALTLGDTANIVVNTSTGTKIGTATGQKLAFHNSTPVIQRAGAAQAAVATTGSTNVAPFGYTTSAQADAIVALVNEIRATLVEKGLMKGAA